MNRAGEVVYHVLALAALAAHLLLVVSWFGFAWVGIRAWTRRSWVVVAVPFVSFSVAWVVILIGNETIGWTLTIGYLL